MSQLNADYFLLHFPKIYFNNTSLSALFPSTMFRANMFVIKILAAGSGSFTSKAKQASIIRISYELLYGQSTEIFAHFCIANTLE